MVVPAPPKWILPSLRWSVPPRSTIDSPFCIQFWPVTRLSFFCRTRRPQNVKNTSTWRPEAAAVVARIMTGQTRSRSLLQHTIDMRFCRLPLPFSSMGVTPLTRSQHADMLNC